jgi:hypothetical protein
LQYHQDDPGDVPRSHGCNETTVVASVPAVVHFTSFGADASGAKAGRGAPKARNYLDKNYGGVLLIWDHLFGSYQAERSDIPIRYGLAHPRSAPKTR